MIKEWARSFDAGLGRASLWAFWAGCSFLTLIVLLNGYEVTARYIFNQPTGFMDEILIYANGGLIYIALAWSWRLRSHIRVEVIVDRLAVRWPRGMPLASLIATFVAILAFTITTWLTEVTFVTTWRRPGTILETPWAYPHAIFTVGISLFCLEVLVTLVKHIKSLLAKKETL